MPTKTTSKTPTTRRRPRPRYQLRDKFITHMASEPTELWNSADFKRFVRETQIINNNLGTMMVNGLIRKKGRGEYQITAAGKKLATRLSA